MTRAQIRTSVRSNLSDAAITFYEDANLNDAIQDAYNEVAAKCRCIQKTATIAQVANSPYYDLLSSGVSDYLGTIAIFNLSTNFWLRDDLSLRDLDRLRRDWEKWTGQPQFWVPHSLKYVAIAPHLTSVTTESFTWWYWANAPTLGETDTPLVATDMQGMLETYATADLLEDAGEIVKASVYRAEYEFDKIEYRRRCVDLARADLLLRI